MFDYINGLTAELTPTYVVIDCGGVGYEVNITLIDFSNIKLSEKTKLYIHESIREDAHVLFGFLDKRSRELFRLLISVSGVEKLLKAVKGIGGKTAQRIIVDLKDKINPETVESGGLVANTNETYEDACAALVMLGFAAPQCKKVLNRIFNSDPNTSTENAIKMALTML